jgi:superfamily II DNA or RNA helicase
MADKTKENKDYIQSNMYLSTKGFAIEKKNLTVDEIKKIKKELMMKPNTNPSNMQKPKSFPIYRESYKKLYLPRFYGFKKWGIPKISKISEGNKINLNFKGELRDYQNKIVKTYLTKTKETGCGLLEIPCGRGKCLGYGTPIMMYDNSIKEVQNIIEGDIIMSDSYTKQIVYGITKGKSNMYKIEQSDGITYSVNDAHILTLYNTQINKIIDINVERLIIEYSKTYIDKYIRGIIIKKYENKLSKSSIILDYKYTNIKITKKDKKENYYGFCVGGNHRFLLGDGTVTHNTVMALNIISKIQKKTMVIVHKGFLMNQWIERINQFLPDARVGKIQGQIVDVEDKDIVLVMLQSLSKKEYDKSILDKFGLTIIDECHHISAEVFCRSLFKVVTKHMLGLSATMVRKDGLTKVFKYFIGDIVYKEKNQSKDDVLVKIIEYENNDEKFSKDEFNYMGKINYSGMMSKLCKCNDRTEFILSVLSDELMKNPKQQFMILAHQKSILKYLFDAITKREIATVGYYIGGMKEKDLKITESKQVVIATYQMAEEGLDIKSLSALIMATPKSDVTQSVGRILRMKHENPLIIDIVDKHQVFKNQYYKKRRPFYKKKNYKIITTTSEKYKTNKDEWDTLFDPTNKNIKITKNNDECDPSKPCINLKWI